MKVVIEKSTRKDKKLQATIGDRKIHFGATGYDDFTKIKDAEQRKRYIDRHKKEDHAISNLKSAGFMARHILWNKPSVQQSVNDLNKKYTNIRFINKT